MVTLVGAYLDEGSQERLLGQVTRGAGVEAVKCTPVGVEACRRVRQDGQEIIILVNHYRIEQRVLLPWPAFDHLHSQSAAAELVLKPYEVAVLTRG